MKDKLESYGAKVYMQEFEAAYHWGERIPSVNVIGAINPDQKRRIILAAHYDTRRIAEEDEDESRREEPIPGADDGGSGVGVLLEIARIVSENKIDLGIDFVFFDAEDQGIRGGGPESTDTWCLGSQHWSRQPHVKGYRAEWGILLDMVGAANATFNRENVRGVYRHSPQLTEYYSKVWNLARSMGKSRYFTDQVISPIIDDHYYVNRIAGIPMIDIINKPAGSDESFGPHWHTHGDDIDIIDKNTLGSVGQVVTAVIYRESAGRF
jgi:Zn-dependent M28 family amino/carboxypeptidase